MRVLVIAPSYDLNTPGESWSTYKWVQGISASCETVVLTQHRSGWDQAKSPTGAAQVINWDEPKWPGMNGRIGWELKPGYIAFYYRARKWIKQALRRGEHFDLIHQINPLALRYPCPARNLGVKYIIGPLAGSLTTPEAFKATTPERQWYRKLRHLDTLRLRYDPWLKSSYAGAAAIIGVAPYVQALLSACAPRRFEIMAETGVEEVCPAPKSAPKAGEPLRLLFVGRLIRTKGILEAIESVAMAAKHCAITFDIVGTGDLAAECQQRVTQLGLGEIVRLHGRVTKEEVFRWYDRSDAFLFPSYREPSGNVVFEAMSRGLPVIGSSIGGPGYVITDACGYRVEPKSQRQYIEDLATAIQALSKQPNELVKMSAAALQRMTDLATWPAKQASLNALYAQIAGN